MMPDILANHHDVNHHIAGHYAGLQYASAEEEDDGFVFHPPNPLLRALIAAGIVTIIALAGALIHGGF
jgi:hypothetical protein